MFRSAQGTISCGYLALLKHYSLTLSIYYSVTQPCPYNTLINSIQPRLAVLTRQGDDRPSPEHRIESDSGIQSPQVPRLEMDLIRAWSLVESRAPARRSSSRCSDVLMWSDMVSGSLRTKWRQIGGVPPCLPVLRPAATQAALNRVFVAFPATLSPQLAAAT